MVVIIGKRRRKGVALSEHFHRLQGLDHASPVPLEFLRDIFNAKERLIRRFVRAFAYAANGVTREEKLFFLIGLGGEPSVGCSRCSHFCVNYFQEPRRRTVVASCQWPFNSNRNMDV
jgi:hypothetical protein